MSYRLDKSRCVLTVEQPLKLSAAVTAWIDGDAPRLFGHYVWHVVALLAMVTARLMPTRLKRTRADLWMFVTRFPGTYHADKVLSLVKQAKNEWSGTSDVIKGHLATPALSDACSMLDGNWLLGPTVFHRSLGTFKDRHLSCNSNWRGSMLGYDVYFILVRLVLSIEYAAGVRSHLHEDYSGVRWVDYEFILNKLHETAFDPDGGESFNISDTWRMLTDLVAVPLECITPPAESAGGSSSSMAAPVAAAPVAAVPVSVLPVAAVPVAAAPVAYESDDDVPQIVDAPPDKC